MQLMQTAVMPAWSDPASPGNACKIRPSLAWLGRPGQSSL